MWRVSVSVVFATLLMVVACTETPAPSPAGTATGAGPAASRAGVLREWFLKLSLPSKVAWAVVAVLVVFVVST